jgi:hypothetical protein
MSIASQEHAQTASDGQGDPALATSDAKLTVDAAAIRIGRAVFTLPRPNRHHNILWWLSVLGVRSVDLHDQGFVLNTGAFVDRRRAARIADRARQLRAPLIAPPNLYSEDLWDGGSNMPSAGQIRALAQPLPFGWCSPAEGVLLDLTESLMEGLMEDANLTSEDRTAMRWQLEALSEALEQVRAAEADGVGRAPRPTGQLRDEPNE